MTRASASFRAGAYLDRVRAPPAPAKLWQLEQFVRNRSPPSARSPSVRSASEGGASGPPPLDWMYAASWSIWVRSYLTFLRGACGAPLASGMRPDCTWNTTEAEPTP